MYCHSYVLGDAVQKEMDFEDKLEDAERFLHRLKYLGSLWMATQQKCFPFHFLLYNWKVLRVYGAMRKDYLELTNLCFEFEVVK